MSVKGSDTGVATYVGGDMYVGGKENSNLNSETGPTGTYAVEAEGLTVVNGSLAMHPLKDAWKVWNTGTTGGKHYTSRGFRWGVVGFGSQFRPADGKTALVVGGNTNTSVMGSKVGAWGAPGWLGKTDANDINSHGYKASLAGNKTGVWDSNDSIDSVRGLNGINDTEGDITPTLGTDPSLVEWNQSDNLSSVNGTDYSKYREKISKLSTDLNTGTKLPATGTVAEGNAPSAGDSYTIYKYDYQKNKGKGNFFTFYDKLEKEKLITFTSTDTSKSMQVFNLHASSLNLNGTDYTGIDFKFVNVPDNASVVVNVTGANGQTIDFHNGWRFWWNNNNIANDFVTAASGDTTQAAKNTNYAKRAQQIMWNFADASNVVIRGGQATGWIQVTDHNTNTSTNHGAWGSAHDMRATDDPSAAWMGSILVPNGNLQSHVSTNGRVWVGGDFEMLNNETVKRVRGQSTDGHKVGDEFVNESGEKTTSILDMDQERHNLPWNGSYSTSCAAIKWDKVDAEGKALKGTSWTVYGTRDNAVNGTNSITTVADGGWNDADDADNGSVTLGSLAKNATYYVRESGTGSSQYALNTNIYRIVTHDSTDTVSTIDKVYDADGTEITDDTAKQLNNGAIVNKNSGTSIAWSKVDGTDGSTLLAGSTWELTKKGDPDQSWTITDDDSGSEVAGIKVTVNGQEVTSWRFTNSTPASITYVAVDKDGKELATKVQWRSEDPAIATIANNGTQLQPNSSGFTNIVFTAGDKTVTFPVTVSGVTVESFVSIGNYTEGQKISLEQGKTMTLTATVAPEGNTVNWSSSNTDEVSVSPSTGTAVTVTAKNATSGYVTITATEQRSQKKATLKIKVTKPAATTTTVYFKMQDDFNQNNGQKLFLEWKYANGSWPADKGDQPNRKQMTTASGCGEYVSYTINSVMPSDAIFRIRRDKANWTTPQSFYRPNTDGGYSFNGGDVVTLESNTNVYYSAPSGCTVTSAYVENRSHRSTVKNAVFYDQPVVRAITNTTAKAADTRQDEDPKGGQFKVSDLTDGTYTLKETSAPNGFDVSKTKTYTIVIENGQVTSSGLPSAGNIENSRLTGTVNWKKTDETDTSKLLAGSEWKLYKTRNFSWDNGNAVYTETGSTDPVATIKDCVNSSEKTCFAQTGQYTDRDGEAGKFSIVGLEWGEYQLVESKAPDGYNIDTTPHVFRIGPAEGANVKGEWYTSSGFKPETTAGYQKSAAFTVDGGSITNTPGVVLPGTGGEGVNKMYAAGFLAVAIAVAGLALSLRRRQ